MSSPAWSNGWHLVLWHKPQLHSFQSSVEVRKFKTSQFHAFMVKVGAGTQGFMSELELVRAVKRLFWFRELMYLLKPWFLQRYDKMIWMMCFHQIYFLENVWMSGQMFQQRGYAARGWCPELNLAFSNETFSQPRVLGSQRRVVSSCPMASSSRCLCLSFTVYSVGYASWLIEIHVFCSVFWYNKRAECQRATGGRPHFLWC